VSPQLGPEGGGLPPTGKRIRRKFATKHSRSFDLFGVLDLPRQENLVQQSTGRVPRVHTHCCKALGRVRRRIPATSSWMPGGSRSLAFSPSSHHFVLSPYRFGFLRPLGVSQPVSIGVLALSSRTMGLALSHDKTRLRSPAAPSQPKLARSPAVFSYPRTRIHRTRCPPAVVR
jgi:hypothetical protein